MSALLSAGVVLGLASACQTSWPPKQIYALALGESYKPAENAFDAAAVSPPNHDGSRDYGLMQINEGNFPSLGITADQALDPCVSIAAAARLLENFSRYNSGKATAAMHYAVAAWQRQHAAVSTSPVKANEVKLENSTNNVNPLAGPSRTGRDMSFAIHTEK